MKSVWFGAKCNNIMVDGISFIEKLSFNALNEGTRLQHGIKMHRRLFGVDVKKIGGDAGCTSTDNRNFCKENGIQTSFVKRGRPSQGKKEQEYVRQELARVRATAMEGSFRTQKEHYAMRRFKARKKETEILYIFFGIHTANAVHLAERMERRNDRKRKQPRQVVNKVPKRSPFMGTPGQSCENHTVINKKDGYKHFWLRKTEQNRPFVATPNIQTTVLVSQIEINDNP